MPPSMALTITPNPYSDLAFMEQLVRAVTVRMVTRASNTTPRPKRVVTFSAVGKGIREIGCVTYSGEEDVEVAEHWLRKVESVIDQI